ncbi:enoyl-CoA hydratase, partial [Gallibacterium sp. AGMB14963]|nr:enoyl-CoA hydratase [Gallibacterium sp. AGMB14963]
NLDDGKWDLILLSGVSESQIVYFYQLTKGRKYDWFGALGLIFLIPERRDKYFCSEWCARAINYGCEGWRFSPSHLATIFRRSNM